MIEGMVREDGGVDEWLLEAKGGFRVGIKVNDV